ncbi:hypothetical protein CWR43_17415 [Rhizobium sullae]|uniref:Uncharacterized protein n=1 Tax=Rhizobium sullae TaxID=50338 RepID=A0A2N0D884_RHISU|nr:hypothetical protein CWR43_17415 [Rhizobium sullae]
MTVETWARYPVSDLEDMDANLPGLREAWEMDLVQEDSSGFDVSMNFSLTRAGVEFLHGPQPSLFDQILKSARGLFGHIVGYPTA